MSDTLNIPAETKPLKIVNLFVLDRSPSMGSIKSKIIEGYNQQLDAIRQLDKDTGIQSTFGLVTFDTTVEVRYLNKHLDFAARLDEHNYRPDQGSGTAFYDGVAKAIKALEDELGSDLSDAKVLVTVLTDGEENSSRYYTGSQVADLIKQFQADYGWTFSFIGANIDVEKLAKALNVSTSNTLNFVASAAGTQSATDTLISARSAYYTRSLKGEDTSKSFFSSDSKT